MKYIPWAVTHLSLWVLMLLSAAGIGEGLLRKHRFNSAIERLVFTIALGLGTFAVIIFLLGFAGLMYRSVLIAITIPSALIVIVKAARTIKTLSVRSLIRRMKSKPLHTLIALILFVGGVAGWVCLLIPAQYPPTAWDATDEHLVVARDFLAAHRPVAVMGIIYPVLPSLNHVLFTWGMALRDDILAQMVEHTFLLLTAFGLYSWGRRQRSSWFGVALAAFWLGNPIILWLGHDAYVDLCLICFAFLGVYALRIFWDTHDCRWWYLSTAMFVMAASAKLPGLLFFAGGMLTGLLLFAKTHWNIKRLRGAEGGVNQTQHKPTKLSTIILGGAVGLIALAPWYGFITFHTGNPFWPVLTHLSRGVWGSPMLVQRISGLVSFAPEPRTLRSFLSVSMNMLTHANRYHAEVDPPLNPLVIVWPLAWLVAIWNREVRWWAIWALGFTLYWFCSSQELRFWLPAVPFCAVAFLSSLRWAIERTRSIQWNRYVYALIALFSTYYGARYIGSVFVSHEPFPITPEARERYLSHYLGGYEAAYFINQRAKPDDLVVVIYGPWLSYHLKPQVLDLYCFIQIGGFPYFKWPEDEQWVRWIESQNAQWILVNLETAPNYVQQRDPRLDVFWPDYELVYSRRGSWIFRHKPVPPDLSRATKRNDILFSPG